MITLLDVIENVRLLLDGFGPTTYGAQNVSREAKPRRWVWVPVSETFGAPDPNGSLHKRLVSVQIHSWGLTEGECEAMQAAVVTAIRRTVNGRRYGLGNAQWTERMDAHRGTALVTTLTIELPMPEIALPLEGTTIGDLTFEEVTITDAPITPEVGS